MGAFVAKVSVIIPVHNTARYLDRCFGSVFTQTLRATDMEILAVDDGSTDGSLDTLRRLVEGRPNVRVFHHEASGSASVPRNVGIEHARGEYLFFLDSDDWLAPNALEVLTQMADETGSGVVFPRRALVDDDGHAKKRSGFQKTVRGADVIACGAYRSVNALKLIRRSIVEANHLRFPTGYLLGEDQAFTAAVYLLSPHVDIAADETYYFQRWRGDGSSARQIGVRAPADFWAKTRDYIEAIVRYSAPGHRRTVFLQRPILGEGGLRAVFGADFTTAFSPAEQRTVFDEACALIRPIWNPSDRLGGGGVFHRLLPCVGR